MPQNKRTLKGVLGGLVGLVALSAVAGVLVTATVTPAIAMTGLAGSQAISLFDSLPDDLDVTAPMEPTTIWATRADGSNVKLASFYQQNRVPVTYDQVAPVLYDAVLSSEDKSFYDHGGVNIAATASALLDYARGTSSRGASTISQQYVKNVLVQRCEQDVPTSSETYSEDLEACWTDATNAQGVDGMERKLQEMRYAIQIEKEYSKNDILLGYLNLANFGGTTYGIEAAAQRYYGVSAAKLNLNQAATLAGMVQNPNRFRIDRPEGSYTNNAGEKVNSAEDGYSATLVRRNYVLNRLLEDGKITQEQYDTTYAEPITPNIVEAKQGCVTAGKNAYFCQYVKSIIESDPAFGDTAEERALTLKRGGLDIYTTLNLDIQQTAIDTMSDTVPASMEGINVGAAGVSIEAGTGRIVSMVQNTNFNETSTSTAGSTSLVYASDKAHGGSSGFNVGSTYKLFTLLAWLEAGHSVNEVLNGTLQTFSPFTICGDTVPNPTRIGNSGGGGGMVGTVMQFTARSTNTGYLAMAQQLDLCDINGMAERLGVNVGDGTSVTATNYPGDVIGSKNISPLDMAGAYATVANKGVYCTPKAIDKILDQSGEEQPLPESSCEQKISPEVAATAAYALAGVMNGGTGGQARPNDGVPVIGKTGTHEATQTMMIESSTKITTAIWVGNAEGNASLRAHGLNNKRFTLARNIQRAANDIYGGDSFPSPDKNLTRRVLSDLPSVIGMTVDEATSTLREAGFSVTVGGAVDSTEKAGLIGAQSPGAGKVASGTTVTIQPSTGNAPATAVPSVVGKNFGQGSQEITKAGFLVQGDGCETGGDPITSQSHASAAPGATITLTCSGDGDDD
ncbi:transglycosylase domain-containing protein [Microbacterium sp. NPDC055903]